MDSMALDQSSTFLWNMEASRKGRAQVMSRGLEGLHSSEMLQNILIDERMRCENHKTNYQTIKAEHTRLQDEYVRSQSELKRMLSEKQTTQEKLQQLLAELRGELLDKTRELEKLKLQVMTPQRLELLKAQLHQEMEAPVREHFSKLEEEAEKYRNEYNKLRYELTFLKSEFDHQREEHERILEERGICYNADLARLEREKEELTAQLQSGDPARDGKRVEALLRDKAQLHQRLHGLEAEVAELRAEKDSTGAQTEITQRIQLRQLAESLSALKALESEKQSLRMHLERVEKELHLSQEQRTTITSKIHKAEREINALHHQVEEITHTHKLELANVKLEYLKAKGEVETERDVLQTKVESLQADFEVLKATVEINKDLLSNKEREMMQRLQVVRGEEMQKLAAVQEEKLELEHRLSESEQLRAWKEASGDAKTEEFEDRLRSAQLGEEVARKELTNIKAKLQQQGLQLEELEKQKTEGTELKQENEELHLQINNLSHSQSELMATNGRLRQNLDTVREELRNTCLHIEKTEQESERVTEQKQVKWLEEKHKLQEKEAELEEKYTQVKERLQRAALAQKKRKNMTEAKEKKLHDKIQLMKAKIEELEIETQLAKKNIPYAEEHAQLSRHLKELQKRHTEFQQLLLGNHMASTPLHSSLLFAGPECSFTNLQEEQYQRELTTLQKRLEELENSQLQQLQELTPPLNRDREILCSLPQDRF